MKDGFIDTMLRIFMNSFALGTTFVLLTLLYNGFGKIQPTYYFFIAVAAFALTVFLIMSSLRFTIKQCRSGQR